MDFEIIELKPFGVVVQARRSGQDVHGLDVQELRKLFRQHQLVVLRGFQTFRASNQFADYCERWGEISLWPFGKVLELIEQKNPEDHIFDHSYVPMHWDGMYRPQIPEYQIFHCMVAPLPGKGGRTTFSNTIRVLENASDAEREQWGRVTGVYQRKMEFYNSKTVSPIVTKHPDRELSVIRYNEPPSDEKGPFVNPSDLEFTGLREGEEMDFHRGLIGALYSPENFYAHEWETGDVVISDNFSLLHGREGFVSGSPRHIQRVHVLSEKPFANPGLESYK